MHGINSLIASEKFGHSRFGSRKSKLPMRGRMVFDLFRSTRGMGMLHIVTLSEILFPSAAMKVWQSRLGPL
jgi:hypothetical protein